MNQNRYCLQMVECAGCAELDDTGWMDIIGTELSEGIMVEPNNGGPTIRFRRKNGIVFINGVFGLKNYVASPFTHLFTLPEGFRISPRGGYFVNTATSGTMSRIYVGLNGAVGLEWIKNLSNGASVLGDVDWVGVNISFPAD